MLSICAGDRDELVIINGLVQPGHLAGGRFLRIPVSGVNPTESDQGQDLIEEIDRDVEPRFLLLGRKVGSGLLAIASVAVHLESCLARSLDIDCERWIWYVDEIL